MRRAEASVEQTGRGDGEGGASPVALDRRRVPMIKATVPMLAVPDIDQAVAYYRDRIGFRVVYDATEAEKYAVLQYGDASLHLTESARSARNGSAGDMGGIFLVVDDVDVTYDSLRVKGAFRADFRKDRRHIREHPPENKPYGFRDMMLLDPHGYRLCFAQPLEATAV